MKKCFLICLFAATCLSGLFGCVVICSHEYDEWVVITPATCTETGTREHICSNCSYKESEIIPETHTFSENWVGDETNHWHMSTCGHDVKSEEGVHTWVNETCSICSLRTPTQGLVYTLIADGTEYSVRRGTVTDANIVIPAIYNGLPVTTLNTGAFFSCYTLISVSIPDTITSISRQAFAYCRNLTSISIPNSVTSIDEFAFFNCNSLTGVSIPNSVTSIGMNAFDRCESIESITVENGNPNYHSESNCLIEKETKTLILGCKNSRIPTNDSVTSIGMNAFSGCSNLTNIIIPDNVTSIGAYAFNRCSSLANVTLGNGVNSISMNAFDGCSSLANIIIPNNVTSISYQVFNGCSNLESITVENGNPNYHSEGNCLIETQTNKLISGCKNSIIPTNSSVTSIGSYAFYGCSNLTSIIIPDNITSISNSVFYGCNNLANVTIGNSVTSIGSYAFYNCSSLSNIMIPDSVTSIGNRAFHNCSNSVTSITVESGNNYYHSENNCLIETQTNTLILGCNDSSIPINGSVTSIGDRAFYGCSGLTSIIIPDTVTSIGEDAFYGCDNLTSIIIPDSITSIGRQTFYGCKKLENVSLPDSVTYIGYQAFYGCDKLQFAELDNAEYLGNSNNPYLVFIKTKSNSITSLTINSQTRVIACYAFFGNHSLTNITIPDGVTSIGEYTFFNCDNLTNIVFNGTTEQWQKIKRDQYWDYGTENYTVICTNGTVSKDGTVTPTA